jgi:hypothetical protein
MNQSEEVVPAGGMLAPATAASAAVVSATGSGRAMELFIADQIVDATTSGEGRGVRDANVSQSSVERYSYNHSTMQWSGKKRGDRQ